MSYESRLKQKENRIDELESFLFYGMYYYNQQPYLLFEPKSASFTRSGGNISNWKSTGTHNESNINLGTVADLSNVVPKLLNQNNRLSVTFARKSFKTN